MALHQGGNDGQGSVTSFDLYKVYTKGEALEQSTGEKNFSTSINHVHVSLV